MSIRFVAFAAIVALAACSDGHVEKPECDTDGTLCADGEVCSSHVCVACAGNDECGALACLSGRCRACTDDVQCGPGRLCQGGQCTGCEKSADCPLQQACVDASCVPCASASDCGDGRACVDQKCQACADDSACDSGLVCIEGACVPCTDTQQCSGGLACVAGSCQACTDSSECLAGDVCAGGVCGACASRDQCPTGQVCAAGHCANCANSADCDSGEACVNGLCGACGSSADCEGGQVCRDGVCGRCGTSAECDNGLVCRAGACEACASRAECALGEVCVQGSCRACQAESECNPGEACADGACGACTSADQCDAGEGCVAGACGPCASPNDCRAGEICRDTTHRCAPPGDADHLELVDGQSQTGLVSTRLAKDLVVRVVDQSGDAVPDVALDFTVTEGGGTPGAATVTSDRSGLASTTWLLGPAAGAQTLVVSRDGAPLPDTAQSGHATVLFGATANEDTADHLVMIPGGDGQSVAAGTQAPTPLAVQVVDRYGNAVPGTQLTWTVTAGSGTLAAATTFSDALGETTNTLTLDTHPGTNTVVVKRVPALPDVEQTGQASATFTLTGVTGAADDLDKVQGDNQTGTVTTILPIQPQVRVVDRFSNPVSGVQLVFAASDGQPTHGLVTSDVNGLAETPFTLSPLAGTKTMTVGENNATLPDVASTGRATVTFTETALAGAADHLDLVQGDGQNAPSGSRLPVDPQVKVVDKYENAVAGTRIAFDVTSGGGTASPATATSDSLGLVSTSFTLGLHAGSQTLLAHRASTSLPDVAGTGRASITFTEVVPAPVAQTLSPSWLPLAGGWLVIDGQNFGSDTTVTVGGLPASVTNVTATELTVTAPDLTQNPTVAAGNEDVVVTSGGAATAPLTVFYALKFTPFIDGSISTDWPAQAHVASDVDSSGNPIGTDWDGNELRDLYLGYDDNNVYIGVKGEAQQQNGIVGYIWENGLTSTTRPNASGDIRLLSDACGDKSGDGGINGGYGVGSCFSLDDLLSAGFDVTAPGWVAHYGFGRTGNAPSMFESTANAEGVRDLFNANDFGWAAATVAHSAAAQEFCIPWRTFATDTPQTKISQFKLWLRIDACGGTCFSNQSLPPDPNAVSTDANAKYVVTKVSTLDVR